MPAGRCDGPLAVSGDDPAYPGRSRVAGNLGLACVRSAYVSHSSATLGRVLAWARARGDRGGRVRLTRIRIMGYKRLADASCNVDGRLIALVGPNEAGKSSVLEALAWLSDAESGPLGRPSRSRSLPSPAADASVVDARFALDDEDRAALADLTSDTVPRTLTVRKVVDGGYRWILEPEMVTRRGSLEVAAGALSRLAEKYPDVLESSGDEEGPDGWIESLGRGFAAPDSAERKGAAQAAADLRAWLTERAKEPGTTIRLGNALMKCEAAVAKAVPLLDGPTPNDLAGARLWERRPEFLLFREAERVLETEYNLDDTKLIDETPPALVNLLALGDTDVRTIVEEHNGGDITRMSTLVKKTNRLLSERLQPTWRQSELTVAIDVDGSSLHLLVDEIVGDARTAIHERSDGLKTFIALVCFLARHRSEVPPVLMLDEAETHLHYDAQADLVDVLTNHVATSKVIYTTHSPGCLPPDLGTGIRLVAPDPARAQSTLRNNFWESNEPGFSPLLFAMGAGAAAFSVCRRAVLAEGPSDMILLPSLIRLATGVEELGYQVAPGLSVVRTADLATSAIAARMAYLVDGDAAGDRYRTALVESGVEDARIFGLPKGCAIEDLIAPDCYLGVVHALMSDAGWAGPLPDEASLKGPGPVATRLRNWCRQHGAPEPGKTAVASRLVQDVEALVLATRSKAALTSLHNGLTRVLN